MSQINKIQIHILKNSLQESSFQRACSQDTQNQPKWFQSQSKYWLSPPFLAHFFLLAGNLLKKKKKNCGCCFSSLQLCHSMTIVHLVILWLIALNRGLIRANQTKSTEVFRKRRCFWNYTLSDPAVNFAYLTFLEFSLRKLLWIVCETIYWSWS